MKLVPVGAGTSECGLLNEPEFRLWRLINTVSAITYRLYPGKTDNPAAAAPAQPHPAAIAPFPGPNPLKIVGGFTLFTLFSHLPHLINVSMARFCSQKPGISLRKLTNSLKSTGRQPSAPGWIYIDSWLALDLSGPGNVNLLWQMKMAAYPRG